MGSQKLALKEKLGYGVCDLGGNLFFTMIGLWLMFYLTEVVGMPPAQASLIVVVGKIWDAVTDPTVGFLSDRTKSRWGRRRSWILWGAAPLFLTMIFMFTNPQLESQTSLFIWGVIAFCLLNTAYTMVNIPYNSLTPELTSDYHERSLLNGYRFMFAVIGTFLGAGATLTIADLFPDRSSGFTIVGAIFGGVMMVTALITFLSVKETQNIKEPDNNDFLKTYLKVFKNKPYTIIVSAYTLHITALTIVMGVAAYYFKYIHGNEKHNETAMPILLAVAFIFIPISVFVAKKIGKKIVYGAGMIVFAIAIMILFFFGHLFPITFTFGLMIFAGIGLGFTYAMPYAIVPDAVEYDYLQTGERTEGAFYGVWTFAIKIGQAIAMGIIGLVLSMSGYVEQAASQIPSAQFGIRLLLGPIAAIFFILSVLVLYFYPITEKRYSEILEEIKKMESKGK